MNTATAQMHSMKSPRRWVRLALIALGIAALVGIGALLAFIPYANDNSSLKAALEHVESGAIPDEPPEYAAIIERDLKAEPAARVVPGTYSSMDTVNEVTYNAVLNLKADGKYEYALTVGNSRVFKLYEHKGKWWVQGKVMNTVMLEGHEFLAAPSARDHKTPSRERILQSDDNSIVLHAHYGQPVKFDKVER